MTWAIGRVIEFSSLKIRNPGQQNA